ncbi:hypothetical protein HWV62_3560 [Athelia sp. TMB]|nr:hypothetical protein HWV62_3560 [Athelia sp. TMB]
MIPYSMRVSSTGFSFAVRPAEGGAAQPRIRELRLDSLEPPLCMGFALMSAPAPSHYAPDSTFNHVGRDQYNINWPPSNEPPARTAAHDAVLAALNPLDRRHYYVPPCMPGTRQCALDEIHTWLDDYAARNVLWLSGGPGAGKSVLASTAVAHLEDVGRLGAAVFCRRGDPRLSDPVAVWRTVAADLARARPELAARIARNMQRGRVDPARPDIEQHFKYLVEDPARKCLAGVCAAYAAGARGEGPALRCAAMKDVGDAASVLTAQEALIVRFPVVVIDALDECGPAPWQSAPRRAFMQSLARWAGLHPCLKLVVTSRAPPPPALRDVCDHMHLQVGECVDSATEADVHFFLQQRFAEIAAAQGLPLEWPSPAIVEWLTCCAAGSFRWAETVARFLEHSPAHNSLTAMLNAQVQGAHEDMVAIQEVIARHPFQNWKRGASASEARGRQSSEADLKRPALWSGWRSRFREHDKPHSNKTSLELPSDDASHTDNHDVAPAIISVSLPQTPELKPPAWTRRAGQSAPSSPIDSTLPDAPSTVLPLGHKDRRRWSLWGDPSSHGQEARAFERSIKPLIIAPYFMTQPFFGPSFGAAHASANGRSGQDDHAIHPIPRVRQPILGRDGPNTANATPSQVLAESVVLEDRPPNPGSSRSPQRESTEAHHTRSWTHGHGEIGLSNDDPGSGWVVVLDPSNTSSPSARANPTQRILRAIDQWAVLGSASLEYPQPNVSPPLPPQPAVAQADHDLAQGLTKKPSLRRRNCISPVKEDVKQLLEECALGKRNAQLLSEALASARPIDLRNNDAIRADLPDLRNVGRSVVVRRSSYMREFLGPQQPLKDRGPPRNMQATGSGAVTQPDVGDAPATPLTTEEDLLAAMLESNKALLGALQLHDDLERAAQDAKTDRRG